MRWMVNGLRRPPLRRSTVSERLRFQRQRAVNIGAAKHRLPTRRPARCARAGTPARPRAGSSAAGRATAAPRRCWPPPGARSRTSGRTSCAGPGPSARLIRAAERAVHDQLHAAGLVEEALEARCRSLVGSTPPSAARPAARVVHDHRRRHHVDIRALPRRARSRRRARRRPVRSATALRSLETSSDSSSVRPGASPSQNGTVGVRAGGVAHPHDPVGHLDASARGGCPAGTRRPASTRSRSPR